MKFDHTESLSIYGEHNILSFPFSQYLCVFIWTFIFRLCNVQKPQMERLISSDSSLGTILHKGSLFLIEIMLTLISRDGKHVTFRMYVCRYRTEMCRSGFLLVYYQLQLLSIQPHLTLSFYI